MRLAKITLATSILGSSILVTSQDATLSSQLDSATLQQILSYVSSTGNMAIMRNVIDEVLDALELFTQSSGCGESGSGSSSGSNPGSTSSDSSNTGASDTGSSATGFSIAGSELAAEADDFSGADAGSGSSSGADGDTVQSSRASTGSSADSAESGISSTSPGSPGTGTAAAALGSGTGSNGGAIADPVFQSSFGALLSSASKLLDIPMMDT